MNSNDENVLKLGEIQNTLVERTGTRVRMKANMGRSRIIEREGTVAQAHPSLFIIKTDEKRGKHGRQSYQYVDILTGMVELFDPDTGKSWFPECERKK